MVCDASRHTSRVQQVLWHPPRPTLHPRLISGRCCRRHHFLSAVSYFLDTPLSVIYRPYLFLQWVSLPLDGVYNWETDWNVMLVMICFAISISRPGLALGAKFFQPWPSLALLVRRMVVLYLLITTEFRVRSTLTVVVLFVYFDLMYSDESSPLFLPAGNAEWQSSSIASTLRAARGNF